WWAARARKPRGFAVRSSLVSAAMRPGLWQNARTMAQAEAIQSQRRGTGAVTTPSAVRGGTSVSDGAGVSDGGAVRDGVPMRGRSPRRRLMLRASGSAGAVLDLDVRRVGRGGGVGALGALDGRGHRDDHRESDRHADDRADEIGRAELHEGSSG